MKRHRFGAGIKTFQPYGPLLPCYYLVLAFLYAFLYSSAV